MKPTFATKSKLCICVYNYAPLTFEVVSKKGCVRYLNADVIKTIDHVLSMCILKVKDTIMKLTFSAFVAIFGSYLLDMNLLT